MTHHMTVLRVIAMLLLFTMPAFGQDDGADENNAADQNDTRDDFEASFYAGIAIDTFASGDVQKFLNPEANERHERGVGGFDFGYRLTGAPQPTANAPRTRWMSQLWVYGETVHGVRSTDVDCAANKGFPTCDDALKAFATSPAAGAKQAFFTIRNATSLEAFTGLRWEFLGLQQQSTEAAANLYVKAQAGFINIAKGPEDLADLHHIGVGAVVTNGTFEGSYFEVGVARNDLFADKTTKRLLVDGLLSREVSKGISFFAQIIVDSDRGDGADSVQTYIGFDFDLSEHPFQF